MKTRCLCIILFITISTKISSQNYKPYEDYIANYYSLLNNLGDKEIALDDKMHFKTEIIEQFYKENETVLTNDIIYNGSTHYSYSDYLDNIILNFSKGVQFSYSNIYVGDIEINSGGLETKITIDLLVNTENIIGRKNKLIFVLRVNSVSDDRISARIISTETITGISDENNIENSNNKFSEPDNTDNFVRQDSSSLTIQNETINSEIVYMQDISTTYLDLAEQSSLPDTLPQLPTSTVSLNINDSNENNGSRIITIDPEINTEPIPFLYNGKWGYTNSTGQIMIKPQLDETRKFSDGFAAVKRDNRWGFISKQFEFLNGFLYKKVKDFNNGLAAVRYENRWGLINTQGKYVVRLEYQEIRNFSHGYAAVKFKNKWGFVNLKGELSISARYNMVFDFSNGYAIVMQKRKNVNYYGLISEFKNLKLPIIYEEIGDIKNNWVNVKQDGNWIKIDL